MTVRVLRLLEYTFSDAETAERHMSQWGMPANGSKRIDQHTGHYRLDREIAGFILIRSATLPSETLDPDDEFARLRLAVKVDPPEWAQGGWMSATEQPTRETRAGHTLLWPPHEGRMYASSALCSCGKFQWDADSANFLYQMQQRVRQDWGRHVDDEPAAPDNPSPDDGPEMELCRDKWHTGTVGPRAFGDRCPTCNSDLELARRVVPVVRGIDQVITPLGDPDA